MRFLLRPSACAVTVLTLFALLPALAGAHEVREVGEGKYRVVVGFLDEPAFAGELNGLDLRVTLNEEGTPAPDGSVTRTPVEGLAASLQAEVIFGDQRMALPLEPAFGDPGAYAFHFFPMVAGDYTFHIFGTIEGVPIDEFFTSSPEGFNSVQPVEPLQFPKPTAGGDASAFVGAATHPAGDGGLGLDFAGDELLVALGAAASIAVQGLRRLAARRRLSA